MHKSRLIKFCAACALSFGLYAQGASAEDLAPRTPTETAPLLEDALSPFVKIGKTKFKVAAWKIYDAVLFAPAQAPFNFDAPFALRLTYNRSFRGSSIAKRTAKEISKITDEPVETYRELRQKLAACFVDVQKADSLTGVSLSDDLADFYFNGEFLCRIEHPEFKEQFFGIWLSKNARYAKLSAQLKGEG